MVIPNVLDITSRISLSLAFLKVAVSLHDFSSLFSSLILV